MSDTEGPDDDATTIVADDPVKTPAIGPPSSNTERRQSPTILAPAARVMDPSGNKRRIVSVVVAASHVLNNTLVRELRDDDKFDVVAQASSLGEAESDVLERMPHVALVGLDLGRDDVGVLALCNLVREQAPVVAIVAVAESDRPDETFAMIRAGASSCFFGRTTPMTLRRTVVGAQRRESVLSPGVAQAILDDYARMADDDAALIAPAPALTATEDEVLHRLADGETPQAVADRHEVTTRMIGLHAGYAVAKLHRTYHDDAQFRLLR